jgi:type II secretory pathway component PulM
VNGLLDRLRSALSSLAPRERMLLGGAGATLLVAIFWVAIALPVLGGLDRARARVAAAERDIELAQRFQVDLREMQGRLATVEQRIQSGPMGNIFTTLEELSK